MTSNDRYSFPRSRPRCEVGATLQGEQRRSGDRRNGNTNRRARGREGPGTLVRPGLMGQRPDREIGSMRRYAGPETPGRRERPMWQQSRPTPETGGHLHGMLVNTSACVPGFRRASVVGRHAGLRCARHRDRGRCGPPRAGLSTGGDVSRAPSLDGDDRLRRLDSSTPRGGVFQ